MIRFRARGKPRARGEPAYIQWVFGEGAAGETRAGFAVPDPILMQGRMMIHLLE